jgi:hypothetical protein
MGIGHKMLKWWLTNYMVPSGVRCCTFANVPSVQVRFGLFAGRLFVFCPRPEFEGGGGVNQPH